MRQHEQGNRKVSIGYLEGWGGMVWVAYRGPEREPNLRPREGPVGRVLSAKLRHWHAGPDVVQE